MSLNPSNQSFLSSPKYGYDFVVATSQASINSGLLEYLDDSNQPISYLCFLADSEGNPTVEISLGDLMKKTGGINPFEIPEGISYDDPRISTLTKNMFVVGLKIQLGLPSGILPKDLPKVIQLGNAANNVGFNLLCSQFTVIQNSPPSGFGSAGTWNVWSQPANKSWHFSTRVNLVYKDLDSELNTPYFNNHPKKKQALINQLKNLNSGAFSLQQLLFDLDNAAIQSIPTINGIESGSDAEYVITKSFVDLYFQTAKAYGEPILSVHAVDNQPDNSSLRLTDIEREVGQFVDANGAPIENPSPVQEEAATLAYLCAVNNNKLPGAAVFSWNWLDPNQISDFSGVIAVNRNTLAQYYSEVLVPVLRNSCIAVKCDVTHEDGSWITGKVKYKGAFTSGQNPTSVSFPGSGAEVLKISYCDSCKDSTKDGATYGELKLNSKFDCSISFSGNQITIVQHLLVSIYLQWDATGDSVDFFDKKYTDVYTLSVDQNGDLQMSAPKSTFEDNSKKPDRSWIVNLFTNINTIIESFDKQISGFLNGKINDIPATDIKNFIFPGANVLTYKDVQFSENQDLISEITYLSTERI
ncbi:hypothetical protein [Algoriphagus chordae]|uniref:Uncharacterized protein n=1 Tax=Algoriphagus chordae TaxID=237019 RepID=A0A2W7R0F2_9BACT|nr:hypothetical protein [Algoriphagus chordae]PZX54004.1 hypothetical protein LV85_01342 [Algoriphagus chordae]